MYGHRTLANYRLEVSSQSINGGNLIRTIQNSAITVFRQTIHHPIKNAMES